MDATEAARAFVNEHFPKCLVAFFGGNVVRGEATESSDLDIVVITAEGESYYHKSLHAFGWPIQVFVYDSRFYKDIFVWDARERRPVQALICLEGDIIKNSDGLAEQIKNDAKILLEKGPVPLGQTEIDDKRYTLTERLNDFIDSDNNDECMFIINELVAW